MTIDDERVMTIRPGKKKEEVVKPEFSSFPPCASVRRAREEGSVRSS
jgi:hypothetical protein